jgi:hypothetical protein
MEFSEVRLSFSLFTNTNKVTKIINNSEKYMEFLTMQLQTKKKISLNTRLRITEYKMYHSTVTAQDLSASEAIQYK